MLLLHLLLLRRVLGCPAADGPAFIPSSLCHNVHSPRIGLAAGGTSPRAPAPLHATARAVSRTVGRAPPHAPADAPSPSRPPHLPRSGSRRRGRIWRWRPATLASAAAAAGGTLTRRSSQTRALLWGRLGRRLGSSPVGETSRCGWLVGWLVGPLGRCSGGRAGGTSRCGWLVGCSGGREGGRVDWKGQSCLGHGPGVCMDRMAD
eukprot:360759-Chlamydomonas_euryale.AAC.4